MYFLFWDYDNIYSVSYFLFGDNSNITFCLDITVTSTVFVFYFLFRDHSRTVNHEASDRERSSHEDSSDHGSAFEAYRKPAMSTFGKVPAGKGFEPSKHIR